MKFYEQGRKDGDFEAGIRMALQAILASPQFLFRLEEAPATARAGPELPHHRPRPRVAPVVLPLGHGARRRAAEGRAAAARCARPAVLEKQVRRMLADPRVRGAGDALRVAVAAPAGPRQDPSRTRCCIRSTTTTLAEAMQRETELLLRQHRPRGPQRPRPADRRLHVRQRAPGAALRHSERHRRRTSGACTLTDENRRGLLGQGSILTLTSVADRTSPVLRGKWVHGSAARHRRRRRRRPTCRRSTRPRRDAGDELLSVRERMEEHRKNPACTLVPPRDRSARPGARELRRHRRVAHQGQRRAGRPAGELYDGTQMDGPAGLRSALLKHQDVFLRSFTESLMTYALGRRVEYFDMPTVRAIVRDAAKDDNRFSAFVLGVVNSPAFQMSRAEAATTTTEARRAGAESMADEPIADCRLGERRWMFITKKHISRRTVLRGLGVTVALPFLDAMVPARTLLAKTAAARRRCACRHRDGARLGRQHAVRPREEPVVAGRGRARLRPDARAASRRSSRSATTSRSSATPTCATPRRSRCRKSAATTSARARCS